MEIGRDLFGIAHLNQFRGQEGAFEDRDFILVNDLSMVDDDDTFAERFQVAGVV